VKPFEYILYKMKCINTQSTNLFFTNMFYITLIVLILTIQIDPIDGSHFRGGIISW